MDYVVFGIGYGATILVLGLLLRDFGPRLRFRRARDGSDVLGAEELVAKVRWARFCTALGTVLALAGAAFLVITLVAMILIVSDDTGLWVMATSLGVLLLVTAYWTWAYFHRFGSYGILPERVEPKTAFTQPPRKKRSATPAPPTPALDDDDGEVDEMEQLEPPAGDDLAEAADDQDVDVDDDREPADDLGTEPRLQTPEERLAEVESPINHGSAEGDLDLAASRPRRPGAFGPRHAEHYSSALEPDDPAPGESDNRAET